MPDDYRVGMDWGSIGAQQQVAGGSTVAVVVDVLSFSTAVSVAMDVGMEIFPFRWKDERADGYAAERNAQLARGRRHGGISLSPVSIRRAVGISRVVLPSPNGAGVSLDLVEAGAVVVAGCLRNAEAVGRWLARRLVADASLRVTVVAAGERWPGGSLRPGIEDLWGVGAVVSALAEVGPPTWFSPQARTAEAAFVSVRDQLGVELAACASGQELVGYGFAPDVAAAAELNQSSVVPVLTDGAFRAG